MKPDKHEAYSEDAHLLNKPQSQHMKPDKHEAYSEDAHLRNKPQYQYMKPDKHDSGVPCMCKFTQSFQIDAKVSFSVSI